ncbi:hypothetical protein H4582DRAFT_2130267 [Lactarius indigo]|nr:hypothetical protein H4582DRAFT_2130267 [Lactarius indigo]
MVVLVDDEDNEEEEIDKSESRSKIPTPLDQALAAAFAHDSTNPNMVASASAPAATAARAQKGEAPFAHADQSMQKRRRVADDQDQDDDDNSEIEIIVDAPRKRRRRRRVDRLTRWERIRWCGCQYRHGCRRPVRGFGGVQTPRVRDGVDEEEEDFMGMLFENTSDNDFVPLSGLGEGKGKSTRRKSQREELAEEVKVWHNDDSDHELSNDDGPRTHAISVPVFTDALRKKSTSASSSSGALPGRVDVPPPLQATERHTSPNVMAGGAVGWRAKAAPIAPQRSLQARARSATAVFTVSGKPLGSVFLHGNKARIVLVSQPMASPAAATSASTAPATLIASPIPEPAQQLQRRRSSPRPAGAAEKVKGGGKSTAMAGRGRRGKRVVGDAGVARWRRSASLMSPNNNDEDGNMGGDVDVDADADADDGIWTGEYEIPVPPAQAEEMARIAPEEVKCAYRCAFAIGAVP